MTAPLLPEQWRSVAIESAEDIAVVHAGRSVRYGQLQVQIDSLGGYFQLHIRPGDCVALLVDNSIEYIVCCYAIWHAGGIVVGLNTALKAPELNRLIRHCGARLLVLQKEQPELQALLDECGIRYLCVQPVNGAADAWHEVLANSAPAAALPLRGDSPAMVIYTSGTTGHPKGVLLSHANLANNIDSIRTYLAISRQDIAMCVLPFFYSYGNSVLHSHLLSGSRLLLANSFAYPHRVLEEMADAGVTAFYGVPSTYYLLLARTTLSNYAFTQLRYCAQAGGPMNKNKLTQIRQCLPGCDFIVMYGQTEASARLTYLPPAMLDEKFGSVGRGIPGVEISVMTEQGTPAQPEEIGEVCARGKNIMLGYLHDQAETDKVLRNGWLHTGDLGYLDRDGFLFLKGRNSEMIKTGAYRVSPLEIEEVISAHAAVAEVAVVGVEDEVLGAVIKACVVLRDSTAEEAVLKQALLRLCREQLPQYKIPKQVEFLRALPKTASGKIKKHQL